MKLEQQTIKLSDCLLDPNNYRFYDLKGWNRVIESRYHETKVQEHVLRLLRNTTGFELSALKDSIRTNGLVPLEQIVVRQYSTDNTKWVVVEGNRRVAAIKLLLEDDTSGIIALSEDQRKNLEELRVLILDVSESENADAIGVLMAIRHVSGIKEWGAYQQARLIVELMEHPGATFSLISEKLGMSSREVARRFRASKALKQLETDEEYSDYAEPSMYALFHEAVAQPTVRDWLGWDDSEYKFTKKNNLYDFYSLISETEDQQAKITSYEHIRTKLKLIINYPKAVQVLLDNTKSLEEATQIAIEESGMASGTNNFDIVIKTALKALEDVPVATLRTLSTEQIATLNKLIEQIQQVLEDSQKLRGISLG